MTHGRARGGQPKNQNARRHGFYAAAFGDSLQKVIRRAKHVDKKQLADEIDQLRTHLFDLTDKTEKEKSRTLEDLKMINMLTRTIIHAVAMHAGLTPDEQNGIHLAMRDLIHDLIGDAEGAT
jgi:hypothetical protein